MLIVTFFYVTAAFIAALYLYFKWHYTYWKRRGVFSLEPEFPFGNYKDRIKQVVSMGELAAKFYREAKARGEKHVGVYLFWGKVYIPVDIDLIKNILQNDFVHFMNRGLINSKAKFDPLNANLFSLEEEKWRRLRTKLTPAFSSGKIKMMFPTMLDCSIPLEDVFEEHAKLGDVVDIEEISKRFTTDIIVSCAFGLECNSLKDPNSIFYQYTPRIFVPDNYIYIKALLLMILPKLVSENVPLPLIQPEVEDFFLTVVGNTVKYREDFNIFRKDFMHLLLQLKNKGKVTDDESVKREADVAPTMTLKELAAECFIFFAAGFETSATTISFALLELALNQDMQDKLRLEIVTTLEKHDGKVTYDAVMEMTYLHKVMLEALRRHPPPAMIPRVCTKDYKVPNTDFVIEKGTMIHVPLVGIHMDETFYPNPEEFDPERFSEVNKAKRPNVAFLPFGEGPRICIGQRFAYMQVKIGLIAIIKTFKLTLHEKTIIPVTYGKTSFINSAEGGIWLNASKIN